MKFLHGFGDVLSILFSLLLLHCLGMAQVSIQNPQNLEIPEPRVQVLHRIVCRVIGEEFHLKAHEIDDAMSLVLSEGKETEGKIDGNSGGSPTIYLGHWDEAAFAVTDMQLMLHKVVSRERQRKMMRKIVQRLNQIAPVDARTLHSASTSIPASSPKPADGCISAISDASVQGCSSMDLLLTGRP